MGSLYVCTNVGSLYVQHSSSAVEHICAVLQAHLFGVYAKNLKSMYIWHIYGNSMGNKICIFLVVQLMYQLHLKDFIFA